MDNRVILLVLLCFIFSDLTAQNHLPIQVDRTISFETTEGTYMDVDLSFDEKKIVFTLLGDLYEVSTSGGKAIQLTRGLAYNRHAAFSPDGKHIAFMSDASGADHVNVINSDGSGQRILGGSDAQVRHTPFDIGQPVWTPDGNYIAVDNNLYHLAGGTMPLPAEIKRVVQFSSDGRLFYYDDYEYEGRSLQQYDRFTGMKTKFSTLPRENSNPRISPDGHWLAYISEPAPNSALHVRSMQTGEDRLLVSAIEGHNRTFRERYTFAPDSRSILIGYGGKLHRIDVQSGVDHIISFIAQVKADLGPLNYNTYKLRYDSVALKYTRSANMNPKGHQLVFSALNKLYVMNVPNGVPHPLVDQTVGQFQPIYSPDGEWIAYVTWSDTSGGQLWRVPAVGGKPQRLTGVAGSYQNPTWSPDGQQIAIMKSSIDGWTPYELLLISATGTGIEKKIFDSLPLPNHISFTSDGRHLIFTPNQKLGRLDRLYPRLVSIQLDGTDQQVLANVFFSKEFIHNGLNGVGQICPSPDNKFIVYEINEDLYLEPLSGIEQPITLNSSVGTLPVIRFANGGMDPHWEQGGRILSWSYGNKFYEIAPEKIISEVVKISQDNAKLGKMGRYDDGFFEVNVVPDRSINMQVTVPRHYAHGTIALRNVRVISMKGTEVIEHGTILVTDGKFSTIGPMEKVRIPLGSKVFDLRGKTVIPGLIDLHDHVENPINIFSQQSWKYLANLSFGVTTARDPSSTFDSFGYKELFEAGDMLGPRLFTVGCPVLAKYDLKSLEDARAIVQKRARLGAVAVKQYLEDTRLQKEWLLMACREAGLNMTNEGEGNDVGDDLAMIKDGSSGVEHEPVWGNVFNDLITFVSKSGTWHTPTLQIQYPIGITGLNYFLSSERQHLDPKLIRFWANDYIQELMKPQELPKGSTDSDFIYVSSVEAAIRHRGGHVTMGSHGNYEGIGAHWEVWALQMGGLSNLEALQAATIDAARGLGMQQDLGSIETGKLADLIVLDKNPLENIQNTMSIKYVMKDGELFDGNTLATLWPVAKKAPVWRLPPVKDSTATKK